MSNQLNDEQGTKFRLLHAAQALYVEHGYEAMSLRMIAGLAQANPALVSYYFGNKEALMRELITAQLDRLNRERLLLLAACERHGGEAAISAAAILGALIIPVLRMRHDGAEEHARIRLLLRAYGESSPVIRGYLKASHRAIAPRFFKAFTRALPALPRRELGVRVRLGLNALAGVMAGANLSELACAICMGEPVSDALVATRLLVFVSPILTTPLHDRQRDREVEQVVQQVLAVAEAADPDAGTGTGSLSADGSKSPRAGKTPIDRALFDAVAEARPPARSRELEVVAASAFDEVALAAAPSAARAGWFV